MSSREAILQALRKSAPPGVALPELPDVGTHFENLRQQFAKALEEAGGRCVFLQAESALGAELERLAVYQSARCVASLLPGVGKANVDLDSIGDPHQLANVDVAIAQGELAVAENGAVWVTDRKLRHQALYFIAQHLVLVVRASQLVHNMHQAYERLTFTGRGFGVFISGPSKTADIEQALVIGAHGPRSTTVFLIDGRGED